jgi:hypothetical protein
MNLHQNRVVHPALQFGAGLNKPGYLIINC